jgi:hypothetical protein
VDNGWHLIQQHRRTKCSSRDRTLRSKQESFGKPVLSQKQKKLMDYNAPQDHDGWQPCCKRSATQLCLPPLPPRARGCPPSTDKLLFLQRGAAPIVVMVSNTRFAIVLPTGARASRLAVFQCAKGHPVQSQNSYKGASIPLWKVWKERKKEFSRPCIIVSSRWLHRRMKKLIFALQLSVRADLQRQGCFLLWDPSVPAARFSC